MPVSFPHPVVALYAAVSGVLLLYAANAYYLISVCLAARMRLRQRNAEDCLRGLDVLREAEDWPLVTTQLPIFNEVGVVERVIRAVAAMDYPVGRQEIQVLDIGSPACSGCHS